MPPVPTAGRTPYASMSAAASAAQQQVRQMLQAPLAQAFGIQPNGSVSRSTALPYGTNGAEPSAEGNSDNIGQLDGNGDDDGDLVFALPGSSARHGESATMATTEEGDAFAEEAPSDLELNSADDDDDAIPDEESEEPETDNFIVCQYDRVSDVPCCVACRCSWCSEKEKKKCRREWGKKQSRKEEREARQRERQLGRADAFGPHGA